MSALHGLAYRARNLWRALFDRDAYRRELNAELQHHLDLDAMHHGAPAARARFGNPTRVRETLVDFVGIALLGLLAALGIVLLAMAVWSRRERLQDAAGWILEDTELWGVLLALGMAVFAWPITRLLRGVWRPMRRSALRWKTRRAHLDCRSRRPRQRFAPTTPR